MVENAKVKNVGLNAANGEMTDLVKMVLLTQLITRSTVQNASSIASLVLTTEALIAEEPNLKVLQCLQVEWWHGRNDVNISLFLKKGGHCPPFFIVRHECYSRCNCNSKK